MKNKGYEKQMLELFDQEYYDNAVKKYASRQDKELRRNAIQTGYNAGWHDGYKAGLLEGRKSVWKKNCSMAQIDECIYSIHSFLIRRFPNEYLSENNDYALDMLRDITKLRSIQKYCFSAPSIRSVEIFIENKVRE